MQSVSSDFVNTIFANLGTTAQTWYRDFKISLGDQPATWSIFKERIVSVFVKLISSTKCCHVFTICVGVDYNKYILPSFSIYNRCSTVNYLRLLSVGIFYYQQNFRPETSAFVSQNVPTPLQQAIELAQRFDDSRSSSTNSNLKTEAGGSDKSQNKPSQKKSGTAQDKSRQKPTNDAKKGEKLICDFCEKEGHTEAACFKKIRLAAKATPKNV
ncbi:hypothetical protein PHMEG_0004560 [Phytophthora megakarya]|uniref:Retrotransposon gag domain-containing protein n=1 Tax=Phytophthora megakarya TaxID=4795 RepID=A0A225WTL9_9STRA|nr:hypothetical protein PHMEG_0004560 [Phytophthora megakarya]